MLFQKWCIILQLILYFVKKAEKYFDDARTNALKLQLEGLPAALASNLQNHFPTCLPRNIQLF